MFDLVIGVVGRISVGKSSVTKALSEKIGVPFTSFGVYLVKYSKLTGRPSDRKSLQDLGEEFIKDQPRAFLLNVIEEVSDSSGRIIIEGIRHAIILQEIRSISKKAFIVYIDATPETRFNRYVNRKKENDEVLDFDGFMKKDSHVVESEVEHLKLSCDLVVNSDELNINQAVEKIILYLDKNS